MIVVDLLLPQLLVQETPCTARPTFVDVPSQGRHRLPTNAFPIAPQREWQGPLAYKAQGAPTSTRNPHALVSAFPARLPAGIRHLLAVHNSAECAEQHNLISQ